MIATCDKKTEKSFMSLTTSGSSKAVVI